MQQDCHFFPTESLFMIDHNVLVISGLSPGADDTRFGYGKEKKSIDTLGGKMPLLSSLTMLTSRLRWRLSYVISIGWTRPRHCCNACCRITPRILRR